MPNPNDRREASPQRLPERVRPSDRFAGQAQGAHYEDSAGGFDSLLETERSLKDYLHLVVERKWLVLALFVFGFLASALYAFLATPVYTSVTSIEIEEKRVKPNQMLGSEEYVQFQRYLLTQQEVLSSRSMAEALVKKMDLAESEEFKPSPPSLMAEALGWIRAFLPEWGDRTASDQAQSREQGIAQAIMGRVKASPVRNSNIVTVSMEAHDPAFAQRMLQEYVSLYLARNLENRRQESLEAAAWLRAETQKAEKKLREAQSALVSFTVDYGIVDSQDGGLGQVLNLVNKTMEGHLKSREERARLQALKNRSGSDGNSLSSDMKNELTAKLKEELATLESEYSEMKGVYSSNYPKMRMTVQRMKFLRDRIEELETKMVDTALDTAKTREELLKESYEQARAEADRVKSLEAQYSLLKSGVDTATEFHKILLREYKETEIKARTISNNVRIVDPPSLPSEPSKPKKKLIVLLGSLMGLAVGITAAFAANSLDQSVRDPEEVEHRFNARNLGVIPNVKKLAGWRIKAKDDQIEFLALDYPQSPVADALKNIQASIFLSSIDDHVTSLAITSATPGEGKSLMAVWTATVLAAVSRKRVVLVDADMRRPRLHKVFGLSPRMAGLSDFLNSPDKGIGKIVQATAIGGMYVITSGNVSVDPMTLFQTEDFKNLIDRLDVNFDYVIVDTPPVLGFPDTPLICRNVNGVVMVVKQGQPSRQEVSQAMASLKSMGSAKVLGMILNQVAIGFGSYGYGYGHHYYRNHRYYYSRSS